MCDEVWTVLVVEGIKDGQDMEEAILEVGCMWCLRVRKEIGFFAVAC